MVARTGSLIAAKQSPGGALTTPGPRPSHPSVPPASPPPPPGAPYEPAGSQGHLPAPSAAQRWWPRSRPAWRRLPCRAHRPSPDGVSAARTPSQPSPSDRHARDGTCRMTDYDVTQTHRAFSWCYTDPLPGTSPLSTTGYHRHHQYQNGSTRSRQQLAGGVIASERLFLESSVLLF